MLFKSFQSTGSVWSPTRKYLSLGRIATFQSTGSVWSPTPKAVVELAKEVVFNPRAPCGARLNYAIHSTSAIIFQSTGSVWSPTVRSKYQNDRNNLFNPRAPCGARLATTATKVKAKVFSIHGLRVEPDVGFGAGAERFLFSIHGLRVEPDCLLISLSSR